MQPRYPSRRAMLASMLAGGLGAAAGCIGGDDGDDGTGDDGDDDGDDNGDPAFEDFFVEDQEFVLPVGVDPTAAHFLDAGYWAESNLDTRLSLAGWGSVRSLCVDMPVWGPWQDLSHLVETTDEAIENSVYMLYESMEVQPEYARVEIREDAKWSDGVDVTAEDGIKTAALWVEPHEEYGYEPPPDEAPVIKYFDYDMPDGPDGKVYELYPPQTSDWEGLDELEGLQSPYHLHAYWLTGWFPRYAPYIPTHVEPYEEMCNEQLDLWDDRDPDKGTIASWAGTKGYFTEDVLEASREDPPPVHGAWQVDEILGEQAIILRPNEEYYAADRINFDTIRAQYSEGQERALAELMNGEVDFSGASVAPEAMDGVPSKYEPEQQPTSGTTMAWTHYPGSPFHHVEVRQATAFAVDADSIAQNAHPVEYEGISVPGGDVWQSDLFLDDDWIEETLTDYSQDLDRAEELMLEAGAERDSDDIWVVDGERMEFQLATPSEDLILEATLEDQLNQFGIGIQTQIVDSAEYVDRVRGSDSEEVIEEEYAGVGDFIVWIGDYGQNQFAGDVGGLLNGWHNTHNGTRRLRQHAMYDHDQIEELATNIPEGGSMEAHWHRDLYIEVPPIGEPDGDLLEFPMVYFVRTLREFQPRRQPVTELLDYELYNPPYPDEEHEDNEIYHFQLIAWVNNWYLPTGLPLTNNASQLYLNTENWVWLPEMDDAPEPLKQGFMGFMNNTPVQLGGGWLLADPDNPKPGANVVER